MVIVSFAIALGRGMNKVKSRLFSAGAVVGKRGTESRWSLECRCSWPLLHIKLLEFATEMYEKLLKVESVMKNAGFYPTRVFFFALIGLANFGYKAKHQKRAKEHFAVVKRLVTDFGAVNVVHKYKILQAEMKGLGIQSTTNLQL